MSPAVTNQGLILLAEQISRAHSEFNEIFKMELFAKIVNDGKLLTIFVKSPMLDVCQGFQYTSEPSRA